MKYQTFPWGGYRQRLPGPEVWQERFWWLGFLAAALLLFTVNLAELPLQSGQEMMLAQTAREMMEGNWFFPTLDGRPYLEHFPLLAGLIALAYKWGGVNIWMVRLPGALAGALSVSLLYGVAREILPNRTAAIFATFSYLTLFPVARYSRLAMGDGVTLCLELMIVFCVLRSRRDWRWTLGIGLGLGLLALVQGGGALLMAAVVFIFLQWDTPRLLRRLPLWFGLLLGITPVIVWSILQSLVHEMPWLTGLMLAPLLTPLPPSRFGFPFTLLLELLLWSLPGLLMAGYGYQLCGKNLTWGWSRLIWVWTGVYGLGLILLAVFVPVSIIPLCPVWALAAGLALAEICHFPTYRPYPVLWVGILAALGLLAMMASLAVSVLFPMFPIGILILASLGITWASTTLLIARRDRAFPAMLFWGMYLSLLLLFTSPYWLWDLV
ncbi:glycosyltransferase family 39 protein [Spirulina subsalsa FACHB-351]|uniref:Glycosyltransferase family 39 protein n=1 Tax=Spirulina subsalsa FACHB-351 TaxID=234711 RepID=A0ABT3L978_9CYAN|nr:glycosyltransferase family 39 protein [Spirulina subsalsa]MCW6038054.1 glycosyltransferase family 39 protein [Spirulina subsalsa FACHB-351]